MLNEKQLQARSPVFRELQAEVEWQDDAKMLLHPVHHVLEGLVRNG